MMNFQMLKKETDFLFVVIFIFISFFLRLKVIDETIIIAPLQKDARGYYLYAVNLKKHGIYSRDNFHVQKPAPDAFCSPGYPLSNIPFVEFPPTGKMIWNIQRMQVILGCIIVALVFFLAQSLIMGLADFMKGNRFWSPKTLTGMRVVRLIENGALSFLSKISIGFWRVMDPNNVFFVFMPVLQKSSI